MTSNAICRMSQEYRRIQKHSWSEVLENIMDVKPHFMSLGHEDEQEQFQLTERGNNRIMEYLENHNSLRFKQEMNLFPDISDEDVIEITSSCSSYKDDLDPHDKELQDMMNFLAKNDVSVIPCEPPRINRSMQYQPMMNYHECNTSSRPKSMLEMIEMLHKNNVSVVPIDTPALAPSTYSMSHKRKVPAEFS